MKWADPMPKCGRWELGGMSQLQRFPLRSQGFQPHPNLFTLVTLPERGTPQHTTVQISGNSIHLGEKEGRWKPRHPLKGPMLRLNLLRALTLCSYGWTVARGAPETDRKKLSCVASGPGPKGQSPLSLCWAYNGDITIPTWWDFWKASMEEAFNLKAPSIAHGSHSHHVCLFIRPRIP